MQLKNLVQHTVPIFLSLLSSSDESLIVSEFQTTNAYSILEQMRVLYKIKGYIVEKQDIIYCIILKRKITTKTTFKIFTDYKKLSKWNSIK
jgi:hypothetical protein